MSEEVDQNSVPSDHDARWQALEEQVLDAGTEDLPDDILSLRQPQKKKAPKKAKAPSTKVPKPKQQTLNQAMSTSDMERIFSSFHGRESTEEDAIDISKFLVDDDNEDDEDDEVSYNASDYFSTLTLQSTVSEEPASLPLPIAQKAAQHDQFLRLEDEQLTYNDEKKSGLKLSSKKQSEGGATYLAVASKKESLQVAAKISQPSNLAAVAESSPPGGDLEGLFYWIDAKEQSHLFSVDPGSVFLFGRMYSAKDGKPGFKSCCIRIHNAYRCMFLQPKKDSAHEDVVKEINEICRSQGVQQRRVKFVERYYAFGESAAPSDKNWWAKLRYPAKYPPIALKGHYQHVDSMVGATSSLIELFLIKRKLKGPGYLRIQDMVPATQRISHCELEFIVDSPKKVRADEVTRPPPLMNLASVQLHAQLDNKGVASEIVCACISVYRDVNVDQTIKHIPGEIYLGVRPVYAEAPLPVGLESYCKGMGLPGVQRFQNERALLMWLVAKLGAIDADVLIGHNFLGYTVDALLRRCQELNVTGWSTIGRLDLKNLPRLGASNSATLIVEKEACTGRLVMDSYTLAREYFKTVNYKLVSLAEQMEIEGIAKGTSQFEPGTSTMTPEDFQSAQSVFGCLLQVCNCTTLATGVISHLDIVRLTKRLTTIAGNLWSRTLYGARSERIEYLLLHSFHDLKFITPDKKGYGSKRFRDDDDDAEEGKRKAKYQGGMVLDPKCGLYSDYILLLDFNSLYPSLIQEFNICFTTVDRSGDDEANIPPPESLVCRTCSAAGVSPPCLHKCILPKVIKGLVDSRREVKRLMKAETDPNSLALLEIRQKALKLTANSMYGCLGFEHSRFHAQKLAELVTRQGRLALQTTVDLIPQINPSLRVIYGDTDSVMIQTGIKDNIKVVRDLGLELKAKINRRYQSLEIDIDGVFRAILLLKKKKYAALSVVDWQEEGKTFKKEVKGLDMVRRDWCPLSKQVSDAVLNRVLNAEGAEDILDYLMQYMRSVADHVRQGDQYTLDDFVISKSLTKEPESYQGSSFPHASVALRMRQRKELVRVGDLIPYVICDSGDKLCDRAYHVEEVRRNTSLRLDAEWYLSSQIFPPVMRLCEHIQGFSSVQLGEVMGVAFHQSARAAGTEQNADDTDDFSHCGMFKCRDLTECFPEALLLQVVCPHCLRKTPIDPHRRVEAVLADREAAPGPFDLYICTSCSRSLAVDYVANSFTQLCYQLLRQFYESGGRPAAVRAVRSQMTYFRALFDVPHAPGCPRRVKDGHYRRARRCLGIDRRLYTLAEAADPEIKERCDPVDPVHAAAEMLYKRIDHLFVNLDALFSKD